MFENSDTFANFTTLLCLTIILVFELARTLAVNTAILGGIETANRTSGFSFFKKVRRDQTPKNNFSLLILLRKGT